MSFVILIGRILWSVVFLASGMGHFTETDAMAGYAASKKVPLPKLTVQAGGVVLVASTVMVLLGVYADLGFLLQAVFLLMTATVMHDFWRIGDPQAKMTEMVHFNKDLSLAGAAIMLFVFFGLGGGGAIGLTITDSLFTLSL